MRIAAIGATLLLAFASCSSTPIASESPFQQPNSLMAGEIDQRIEQIPYQHREELLQNLMWLAQTGEQTIPAVLQGLRHDNPKVRSSCAWVLGRLRDRRTIPNLQAAVSDSEPTVRMECARTLVMMGDLTWSPTLIEGLDSDRKEVRYLCHEALKGSTGHDFGYDHLNQNEGDLRVSVLRWRQWWSEYSGDAQFAAVYQQKHNLQTQVAAPAGESQPMPNQGESMPPMPQGNPEAPANPSTNPSTEPATEPAIQPATEPSNNGSTGAESGSQPRPNGR